MSKKDIQFAEKEGATPPKAKRTLIVPSSNSSAVEQGAMSSPVTKALAAQVASQLEGQSASDDSAIGLVIENIVGYLGDVPNKEGEMRRFLETLVDSDPMLKEELLSILHGNVK